RRGASAFSLVIFAPVIFIALEYAESIPSPVHAMALDQAIVVEVHCLDEIHLLAFAGVTRVFPDQPLQRKSNHEDASPGSASRGLCAMPVPSAALTSCRTSTGTGNPGASRCLRIGGLPRAR